MGLSAPRTEVAFAVDQGKVFRIALEIFRLRDCRCVTVGVEGVAAVEHPAIGDHVEKSQRVPRGAHELGALAVKVFFWNGYLLLRQGADTVVNACFVVAAEDKTGVDKLFSKGTGALQSAVDHVNIGFGAFFERTGKIFAVDKNVFPFDRNGVFPEIKLCGTQSGFFQGFGVAHKNGRGIAFELRFLHKFQLST